MEITKVSQNYTKENISIGWTSQEKGFGEISIEVTPEGMIFIDTESMGKEHFLKVMELLYDMAEVK